jgi:hypothetical protein
MKITSIARIAGFHCLLDDGPMAYESASASPLPCFLASLWDDSLETAVFLPSRATFDWPLLLSTISSKIGEDILASASVATGHHEPHLYLHLINSKNNMPSLLF